MQASYNMHPIRISVLRSHSGSSTRLLVRLRHLSHAASASARLTSLETAPTSTIGPAPPPPRTVSDAVRQARMSLRLYRESAAADSAARRTSNHRRAEHTNNTGATTTTTTTTTTSATWENNEVVEEQGSMQRRGGMASTTPSGSGSEFESRFESGSGSLADAAAEGPRRLIIELPLPSQRVGFLGRGSSLPSDLVMLLDEGDYPGGVLQRFRVLRKLVDELLEGYDAEFLGLLEDSADGVGLWSCGRDMTLVANITNATVPSLIKLLDGWYGSRTTSPEHTVIAVNPQWTDASSVGQPWQTSLRQRAAEVLDEATWSTLYCARVLRGSRGANGLLHRAWPHRWTLYPTATPDTRYVGGCLLASPTRPPADLILSKLNEAKPDMKEKAKELGLDEPGWF
ncbi:hypothetical protein VOLCADRAFT_104580 [Volvox carteri f. nagariensis]|uniref:DUF1995 domain-containing protein n=1 Tax=Volvox carteri f. nagariensis TaxID=3068 RepID=D8TUL9_VOLCA|nr:uncharacterized protein VOLCADRAFT_104580 [Volvox carteri f. nagariensis]EFJ48729.1 hypothetical protein VOLCADRAFT_104580 [Volvox carteri f. nagariensis]|eukprot:XP_002950061.1 hypothetical protein VOLCADRAFT_104580 [Volvox carteri f. nagariensis]